MAERKTAPGAAVPVEAERPIDAPVSTDAAPADATPDEVRADVAATDDRETPQQVRPRRIGLLALATVLAFVVDLVTKLVAVAELTDRAPIQLVPRVLDLQLIRNPGAAFGFAAGGTVVFTLVAAAVVVFILSTARRLRSRGWALALGLLLGGALGNLGDRLFRDPGPLRGHVVDWIHLAHWPIFNVADTCIVVGGLIAVLLSMRGTRLDGAVEVLTPRPGAPKP
jgi:signal peptidase II